MSHEPVSILWSRRIKPGKQAEFEAWSHAMAAASREFPGHLGAIVLSAPEGRDYHVAYTFADSASLNSWLESDRRAAWMAEVGDWSEAERPPQRVTGLETWFKLPGAKVATMVPPPRWKMWLVTVAAIYPLILALFSLFSPLIADWPLPVRAMVFPLVLVTLMTYVVMPTTTRLLRGWLTPRSTT